MVVAHNRESFNCQACRFQRHCDDSNPAPHPMFAIPEIGLESRTCLLPKVTQEARLMLDLYRHYKNGYLPVAGGIMDQPAVFMESMSIIDAAVIRAESKKGQ